VYLYIGLAILALWFVFFVVVHLGELMNIALIVAVIAIVWHFVGGRLRRR
jgi:hypothetical protein